MRVNGSDGPILPLLISDGRSRRTERSYYDMRLLTIPEASDRLGLKPATVRFWIWTRKIEHVKIGRAVRIPEQAIERIIEQGTIPAEAR